MKTEKCRRCPARIVFLYTKNQRPIPVDAATVRPGDVEFDKTRHTTHFETCPRRKSFRKKKPAPRKLAAIQGMLL